MKMPLENRWEVHPKDLPLRREPRSPCGLLDYQLFRSVH